MLTRNDIMRVEEGDEVQIHTPNTGGTASWFKVGHIIARGKDSRDKSYVTFRVTLGGFTADRTAIEGDYGFSFRSCEKPIMAG